MTLVITELSPAGIAMAADSAITYFDSAGNVDHIDKEGWLKLIRVPSIKAAISYWGMVGAVTPKRFDDWLKETVIRDQTNYDDLESLAEHLAQCLNRACKNKPLPENHEIGIHVVGFAAWEDGQIRPRFYHVHNGHGRIEISETFVEIDGEKRLIAVEPRWVADPRKLFEKHQDFPDPNLSLEENLDVLNTIRPITRNGDYFYYAVIWDQLKGALDYLISSYHAIPTN